MGAAHLAEGQLTAPQTTGRGVPASTGVMLQSEHIIIGNRQEGESSGLGTHSRAAPADTV